MRFSLLSNAVLLGLASFGLAADNSCDDGPFAAASVAGPPFPGGNDPETACDSKWSNGEIIVGIEAWSAKFQLKAVRFKYSRSGWSPVRGSIPDKPQAHEVKEWAPGDEVAVKLWNNLPDDGDPMDAVGRIIITLGGQKIFEVGGAADKVQGTENVVDNGAGLILGVKTRSGAWLSSIDFKMLKSKVATTELVDLKVKEDMGDWNSKQRGIENLNIATTYFVNKNPIGGPNLTYTFTNAESRETKKTITSQKTNQWTVGLKVTVGGKVGIPFLAEGKVDIEGSFQYQRTEMDGTETSYTSKKDLSVTIGTPGASNFLPPQRAARCESWAISGKFESGYDGTVEAELEDGSKYTYLDNGDVLTIGWLKGAVSCEEIDIKSVPAGATVKEAQPTNTPPPPSKRAVQFRG